MDSCGFAATTAGAASVAVKWKICEEEKKRQALMMRFKELVMTAANHLLARFHIHNPFRRSHHTTSMLLVGAMRVACQQPNGLVAAALRVLDVVFGSSPPPQEAVAAAADGAMRDVMVSLAARRMLKHLQTMTELLMNDTEHAVHKAIDVCLNACMGDKAMAATTASDPLQVLKTLQSARIQFVGATADAADGWQCQCRWCPAIRRNAAEPDVEWQAWLTQQSISRPLGAALMHEIVADVLKGVDMLRRTLTEDQMGHMMKFSSRCREHMKRSAEELEAGIAGDPTLSTKSATDLFTEELKRLSASSATAKST